MDHRAVVAKLFNHPSRRFGVELWDGTHLENTPRESRLVLRNASACALLFPPTSEEALATAFAHGDIDIVGDTIDVLESIARWEGPRLGATTLHALVSAQFAKLRARLRVGHATFRGRVHSRRRDREAVQSHYDAPIELFRLFLDPSLTYSCAFFHMGDECLADAQNAKLELIARKLGVERGDALLDIGCGWGSLLAHVTARGARAVGVTVSESQYLEVRKRGLIVEQRDYRELPSGPFDKIASVGMMEHVGCDRLADYFEQIHTRLRPGGLFLNHAIADVALHERTIGWTARRGERFLHRIFPDSELVPIADVVRVAENAGFEVRDVECLREHYALTLRHWLRNLEARFADAERIVGHESARQWRLYMAISAVAFRLGKIGVYQVLLAKRNGGEVDAAARRRASWYEAHA